MATVSSNSSIGNSSIGNFPSAVDYFNFKVVLVGNSGVGKTCLVNRYIDGYFDDCHAVTVGVDFCCKRLRIDDKTTVKLNIWDTAGQERYRGVTGLYYRNADVIILVYDVSQAKSFTALDFWLAEIDKFLADRQPHIVMALLANKADLAAVDGRRQVSEAEGRQLAADHNLIYFETSAKLEDHGLEVVLEQLINDKLLSRRRDGLEPTDTVKLSTPTYRSYCCGGGGASNNFINNFITNNNSTTNNNNSNIQTG